MDAQRNARLLENLQKFMKEWAIPQSRIAKSAGISAATLNQVIKGNYQGDVDGMVDKLSQVLDRERERRRLHSPNLNFIETSASRRLFEIAGIAHLYGEIGVCHAIAGVGKTFACKEYERRNADTVLIEADPGYVPQVFFQELHGRIITGGGSGTLHGMFSEIISRLKESGRLLIIDEAENLPYKTLEMIRRLHDKAGVGMLLVGMDRLLANIRGHKGEFAQLYSRVGVVAKLDKLSVEDTSSIVRASLPKANGVCRVFHKESQGNARRLDKLIRRSISIASNNDIELDKIDGDIVQGAARILMG